MADARKCVKCGVSKATTEFWRNGEGYLERTCKICRREENERQKRASGHYERKREKELARRAAGLPAAEKERCRQAVARSLKRHPNRQAARMALQAALREGLVQKPSACEACKAPETFNRRGASNLHGHHDNYDRPLAVRWLCQPCHAACHAPWRKKANHSQGALP